MEKLVPLLIGLAIFGFKSYQNYIKEQEAALKRKKALVPLPVEPQKPVHKTYQQENNPTKNPQPFVEKVAEMNEIQRFKKEREEHRLALTRKTALQKNNNGHANVTENFDLRKAVVMSIILDRPYK